MAAAMHVAVTDIRPDLVLTEEGHTRLWCFRHYRRLNHRQKPGAGHVPARIRLGTELRVRVVLPSTPW